MATIASLNVILRAQTEAFDRAMKTSGSAVGKFGARQRELAATNEVSYGSLIRMQTGMLLVGRMAGASTGQLYSAQMALMALGEAGELASKGGMSRLAQSGRAAVASLKALGPVGITGGAALGALAVGFAAIHESVQRTDAALKDVINTQKRFIELQKQVRELTRDDVKSPAADRANETIRRLEAEASAIRTKNMDFGFWVSGDEERLRAAMLQQADSIERQAAKLKPLAAEYQKIAEAERDRADWMREQEATLTEEQRKSADFIQQQIAQYEKLAKLNADAYAKTGNKDFWRDQMDAQKQLLSLQDQLNKLRNEPAVKAAEEARTKELQEQAAAAERLAAAVQAEKDFQSEAAAIRRQIAVAKGDDALVKQYDKLSMIQQGYTREQIEIIQKLRDDLKTAQDNAKEQNATPEAAKEQAARGEFQTVNMSAVEARALASVQGGADPQLTRLDKLIAQGEAQTLYMSRLLNKKGLN